jgi:hypothetical protein
VCVVATFHLRDARESGWANEHTCSVSPWSPQRGAISEDGMSFCEFLSDGFKVVDWKARWRKGA